MFQVAASLVFVAACGFGLTVILAMLRRNADAIMSALMGEGAFASIAQPTKGPPRRATAARRVTQPTAAPAPSFATSRSQQFSRAAA